MKEILDDLALKTGTDKSSAGHNYTEVYANFFASLRNKPIKFLEIGIDRGDSVKLWEQYFSLAELHFIDIKTDCPYQSLRSHYHQIDQADPSAINAFGHQYGKFDLIIDDGGHDMKQQTTSLQTLFPCLEKRGYYVIEDLHTSYWAEFGGNGDRSMPLAGPRTTIAFLKNLVDDLNHTGALTGCGDWDKTPVEMLHSLDDFQKEIFSIQFFKSLCIIQKR